MKKKAKPKKENSERWLLTYSDMITLLLALFIVLYAMSNVDQSKYEQLAAALNKSLGNGTSALNSTNGVFDKGDNSPVNIGGDGADSSENQQTATTTPVPSGAASESLVSKEQMNKLEKNINDILNNMDMGKAANTQIGEQGLTISFADSVFFDSGKAELKGTMKKGLGQIARLLNRINNQILVEGYTDNVPIGTNNDYQSNWQLSAARASMVVDYLVEEEGIPGKRVSAIGYGEYRPIASNSTEEGRKKNRRVNITILYNIQTGMEYKK
jgi:Flagellar motor protein